MALGAGTFTVPNKVLPGAYINFVSAARADAQLSERGVAALPLEMPCGPADEVIRLTAEVFFNKAQEIFGCGAFADELLPLREAFRHAREVLAYRISADADYETFLQKIEPYSFHTLGLPVDNQPVKKMFAAFAKRMRETVGCKIQCVLYRHTDADYEGVVSVENAPELVSWVTGAVAGAAPGKSLMNTVYDGELEVECGYTAMQLEDFLKDGAFVFHRVGKSARVLEDINTLTTLSADKGRDFQDNQTVRLIDQIATDIAAIFNGRYLGKTANDESGRVALWSEIVAHHRQLEQLGAIENFEPEDIKVEQGGTKKSVVISDRVTPTGAMAQLYMTVVIQ